jgi:hypothetical protein
MNGPVRSSAKPGSGSGATLKAVGGGLLVLLGILTCRPASTLNFAEDTEKGIVTVIDAGIDVLTYRYLDQLDPIAPPNYVRSCYIHPLYFLDGRVLTYDFPPDHFHHHGLFWTWPVVNVRGQKTQTWHPAIPSLRQHFVRWSRREASGGGAVLGAEVAWKLDGEEVVAEESTTIRIHPADDDGRAVDLEIVLRAVGGTLELRGSPESNKGYGGLCFRGAPLFTGATMTTDLGPLEGDSTDRRFRWADLSTEDLGVAVFVSPDHPGFPTTWLVRNSYAGVINPSWPGLEGETLAPDEPVTLRYRIYIHRGDVMTGKVKEAYETYLAERD